MLVLKIMSGEDAPDGDARACHRLIANVVDVEFVRPEDPNASRAVRPENAFFGHDAVARVDFADLRPRDWVPIDGNCYVIDSATGRTVSSFGCAPLPSREEAA